jgi:replicative DNA helicase
MDKDASLYTLPPQNLEAENSLLSAILIDNDVLLDVVDIVSPQDFYRSAHQKIFTAVIDLFSKSEPVDLITLSNMLKEKNHLKDIGGATFLAKLFDTIPLAVNAPYYAKIIRDKACLRRLIEKSNSILKKCFEDRGDVDDTINFAENAIFEVTQNKLNPSFFPIKKLVEKNISALEELQGNKALITGVPTGFSRLDSLTSGFQKSDLIILAARPSMGKTALALNIARNAAVDANVPVAIFSLEMSKEQLSMRLLCSESKVNSSNIRSGFLSKDNWAELTDAASVLTDAPIFIDDSADISATSIRAKARRLMMDEGLGLVIIDYLQLMRGRANAERRDLEISEISRSLKALAKELDIPVVALSQLNRDLEKRNDKRPMLSDLRESGALEQDADVVAFIYRDEVYNKDENNPEKGTAEIIIAKQRNGPVGSLKLKFFKSYTKFENLASESSMEGYYG